MARTHVKTVFPFALKLAYTVFVVIHVCFNWSVYGPVNFLWECDMAVLTILLAIWTESRLLTSVAALAALVPMCLWIVDLGARICLGHYIFGFAGYMFNRGIPRSIRLISAFHLWLPLLLAWMVSRVGYDRRAFLIQSLFMALLLIVCKIISQPPPDRSPWEAVNINWVYGPSDDGPQTVLPANAYVGLMIVLYPLLIYLPTHFVLDWTLNRKKSPRPGMPGLPGALAV